MLHQLLTRKCISLILAQYSVELDNYKLNTLDYNYYKYGSLLVQHLSTLNLLFIALICNLAILKYCLTKFHLTLVTG